jgi:hypothetical protein
LHGSFKYPVTRLKIGTSSANFFSHTNYFGQSVGKKVSYQSNGLVDFATKYATKLSYSDTARLIAETCGGSTISAQHIHDLVEAKAVKISAAQQAEIAAFASSALSLVSHKADIYEASSAEVIYLTDDICVKQQKCKRDKVPKTKAEGRFYNTRVSLFQDSNNVYKPLVSGIGTDNVQLAKASICAAHASKIDAHQVISLPIVALTDGATTLKNELNAIFGDNFTHILDWYHLRKKVYQTMSMVVSKEAKKVDCLNMLRLLWEGKSVETIAYLQKITPKNDQAKEMLITYLTKNETTIINYECRRKAGKIIGSGRTEKENDILVAKRQKNKGMAWSPMGSMSITLNNTSYL